MEKIIDNTEHDIYFLKNYHKDVENSYCNLDISNIRNEQKHRETCLKNKKKRKSKK